MSQEILIRTATGKEAALVAFYNQLKLEGTNATELAKSARVGRAYLTRVLNAHKSGVNTWKHVVPLLSSAALFLLKQCSAWNSHAEAALAERRRLESFAKTYGSKVSEGKISP